MNYLIADEIQRALQRLSRVLWIYYCDPNSGQEAESHADDFYCGPQESVRFTGWGRLMNNHLMATNTQLQLSDMNRGYY